MAGFPRISSKSISTYSGAYSIFYVNYLDQEHGYLVVRDAERTAYSNHTTRLANFDGARYLSQWARLSKDIKVSQPVEPPCHIQVWMPLCHIRQVQ